MKRALRQASEGFSLIEIIISLVVFSIGILAIARLFPAAAREQTQSQMNSRAGQYADEVFELLRGLPKTNSAMTAGRHPASGYDSLGVTKAWRRYYVVTAMASPLDSLIRVESTVRWTASRPESVRITGYLMP